ncbi:hypothetical protein D3C80_1719220 [compost metagenome]
MLAQHAHADTPGAVSIQNAIQGDRIDLQAKAIPKPARHGFFRPGARVDILHVHPVEVILTWGCERRSKLVG